MQEKVAQLNEGAIISLMYDETFKSLVTEKQEEFVQIIETICKYTHLTIDEVIKIIDNN